MGLPRSGTTLTCELLSQLPDAVGLDEPMDVFGFRGLSATEIYKKIDLFIFQNQATLRESHQAISKNDNGLISGDKFRKIPGDTPIRKTLVENGLVSFPMVRVPVPFIAIKHNAAFTALLPGLAEFYPCFAIIRNPLSVLLSWQTVDIPVRSGHIPAGEMLDPDLHFMLSEEPDNLKRQLIVLNWFFGRFHRFLPASRIIRYEQIIESRGKCLARIIPSAGKLNQNLVSRNSRNLYNLPSVNIICDHLLATGGPFLNFYKPEDILAVRDRIFALPPTND